MKAAVCYEFGQPLIIEEIEIDPPQAGEVLVKIVACAICHSDIHKLEGAWGGALPIVCGHEAAGIVEGVGAGVSTVRVGDHVIVSLLRWCGRCFYCSRGDQHLCETVFALDRENRLHDKQGNPVEAAIATGAFAEYAVVHESQVVTLAPHISLTSASLLACGVITGVGAVFNTAQLPAGCSVVVIGCGGVGLNSVQGAALAGAQPIIALDLVAGKLDAALDFGATHVFDPSTTDMLEAVRLLTNGRGADFVFVTVGSERALQESLNLLRTGGTLVIVGMPASGVKLAVEATNFAYGSQKILGSRMGSTRLQVDVPKLIELYEQGRLKLDELVTATYPLEQINEAIASVKRGEALRNVILF